MKRCLFQALVVFTVVALLLPVPTPSAARQDYETPAAQATPGPAGPIGLTVSRPLNYSVSPALRDLARIAPPPKAGPPREIPLLRLPKALKGRESSKPGARLQNWPGLPKMPSTIANFEGNGNADNQAVIGSVIQPPDTQGEVGPDHYVQWVNLVYSIYDKNGNLLLGPLAGNTLWASNPAFAACDTSNDGDIITLYDPLAERWLMSQFALPNYPNGPFYQCIAISQSPDPTGAWYLYEYQIPVNKMNDYPKFGVWPDAYYMTVNQFNAGTMSWGGAGVAAFERSQMLAGNPAARMVYIDVGAVNLNYGGMLPADLDGPPFGNLPPSGTPGLFVEWDDSGWIGDPTDTLRVWEFRVDWTNPTNSTFGINPNYDPNYMVTTIDVDPDMCGFNRNCIPQPGTSNRLDAISDRLMYRLQYRNFGSYQTLASNHTVDADGTDHAGIHWFILRNSGAGWAMDQEGVYAPDSHHRWMGSFALDHMGNAALGYSISSSSVYPGIRYSGRLATDPPNTLPQGEAVLINGTGSQTSWTNRWGDYSMMSVDPADDCTFWYTQEYYAVNGSLWQTRIGSFRFPNCSVGPTGTLTGQVYDLVTSAGIGNASVQAASSPTQTFSTVSNSSGYYTLTLPVGTYTVTASAYGYQSNSISGVEVFSDTVTVQDIPLTPATLYMVSGTVRDANTGWPLYARLNIVGYPGGAIWNDPVTGFYSVALQGSMTYTFQVEAWVSGYLQGGRDVFVAGDQTEDFALDADPVSCSAPGYSRAGGLIESFDATTLPAGWTVVDNAGSGAVWSFDNPCGRTNLTGGSGNFAIADSDCAGTVNMDTELRTPVLDFTGWSTVMLEFKYDWREYSGNEVGDVDVSVNGAAGPWTNVWRRDSGSDRGPQTAVIDISAIAANQANVMIRFHYYNANYDWWWEVDDVIVGPPVCVPPTTGGLVVGNVYDDNTGAPLNGAEVFNDRGYSFIAAPTADPSVDDAFYTLFSPPGAHAFTARNGRGYGADGRFVNVVNGDTVEQDFYLPAGMPSYAPLSLEATLDMGLSTTVSLTLTNLGRAAMDWKLLELDRGFETLGPFQQPVFGVKPFKQGYPTAAGLGIPDPPAAPPLAAGDVLQSWTPTGVGSDAWGIAYDGVNNTVWVGDGWGTTDNAVEHQRDGTPTGHAWPYNWPTLGSYGPADFTFNWNTGRLWVMNVNTGQDNCIHEIDPALGVTGNVICPGGGTGFATAQRGLAYDPATDTYLAGGWNDLMVYRFDSAGNILQQVNTGLAIAGLAYNADTRHLFVMVNGNPNPVYVLDAANNFTITGQFNVSLGFGAYSGAGLEIDCDGNLWAVDQDTNTVYQFESGETTSMCARDVPWLSENPITGTLGASSYFYRPTMGKPVHRPSPGAPAPSPSPLTLRSPEQGAARVPEAPAPRLPDVVLWDQPLSPVNINAYVDQDFIDYPAYSSYLADDFVNADPWNITRIFVPGNGWNGFTTLANAVSLVWAIYADSGGVPDGDPSGGGNPPVWTIALPPDDPQVALSNGTGGMPSNVTLNLAVPARLPAGHWWLVFYPVMSFGTGGQYGRQPADTTNGYIAQFINPGGGFGYGTSWQNWTVLGPTQQDIAFRLEGSVAQPATQAVDVTFDASVPEVTPPGRYYAQLKLEHDTPYVLANIPVTMTVTAPATWGKLEGVVRGLGYCDASPAPLEDATVLVEGSTGMTRTLRTGADGRYVLWLDEAHSPLTVTVTATDHTDGMATGVMVTRQQTTTVDFDLRWLRPCLSVDPLSLDAVLDMGASTTVPLTLTNSGAGAATFELSDRETGFVPALLAPGRGEWLYRAGTGVPMQSNSGQATLAHPSAFRWTPDRPLLPVNILIYTDDPYHTPRYLDMALQAMGLPYTAHYDGDWAGFEANLSSGTWDAVFVANDNYTPPSSVLTALNNYVLGGGKLVYHSWTVGNDPGNALWTTLGFTFVGNDSEPPDPVYWWDAGHSLFTYPELVPEFTVLNGGLYGIYGQQVEPLVGFEALAGYTTPGPDPNQAALILGNDGRTLFRAFLDAQNDADLDGDGQLDGVELWMNAVNGILNGFVGDAPWLSESPITGTVGADSATVVDVTFDAGVPEVTQPGEYYATLNVRSNDPVQNHVGVPVTMTVTLPATYGKLEGVVRGLGYCDASPAPLEDATVLVEGSTGVTRTLRTGADGRYVLWLDEAHSPFTVTVTAADHTDGMATGVMVTGQQTTMVDFDLRWLWPCLSVDPASFEVWVLTGTTTYTHPTGLDISNNGAAALDFELREIGGSQALQVLYDNGPLVTHYGACGTTDASRLQTLSLGMNTLGFGHQLSLGNRVADDFTISDPGGWQIQQITFFAYQTNAPADPSPITGVYYQIWDGPPNAPTSTVIFGDFTTNRLISSTFSNIQRDSEDTTCNGLRYIFTDVAGAGITLPPGTYWLDWTTDGSTSYTGPWAPPITILGQTTTGNALQYTGSWAPALDSGTSAQQGMPFVIEGRLMDVPWLWEVPVTGTVPSDSASNAGIYFTAMSGTLPLPLGTYTATLLVESNDTIAGPQDLPVTMHIVESFITPTASFTATTPVCFGEETIFTNTTSGGVPPASSYLWDFGDGVTSTLEHPTHLYGADGSYTVTLEACNSLNLCDTYSAVVEVLPAPTAGFTYTVAQLEVTFINTSVNATSYLWDFGDGITGTEVNPVHTYAAEGTYTVTLEASNGMCTDVFSAQVTVGLAPVAGFSSNSPVCLGAGMVFSNTTTGTQPISYLWDFGDGVTSTVEHPTHFYGAAGFYTVTLTASNAFGADQSSAVVEVLPAPTAGFTYTVAQLEVTFTNTSINATSYLWDFGDGITSTEVNPVHVYPAPGPYTVTLTATGSCGVDTATGVVTTYVYGVSLEPPTAAQSGDPGTAVTYTLWLTNTGSVADIFTLTKSASAWTVDVPAGVGPLDAGVGVEVPVVVHIPAGAAGGARDVVTVTATSQGDPTKTDASALTTTANNVYGVLLEPPAATRVGSPGTAVTHTLRLTNTGNTTDTFTLTKSASAWTVDVPASVGPLAAGVGVEVPVVVHIPAGAPPDARDVVTVTATSQSDPAKTGASVLTTRVPGIYDLLLEPPTAARSGDPGTAVTYTLWLTNIGSLTDTFTLTKSASAWTVDMPTSVGPLDAGVGVEVPVVVHIPADVAGGARDVVTVTATSQGDPTKTGTSVLTTIANNIYGVVLEPPAAMQSGDPGTAVTYTLRLTNTGNTTDTFTLATSASAWTVDVPPSVGPLGAGVGVEVPVVVHIPGDATPDARDVVTVTATSQGDPTKSDASVLTTRVSGLYALLLEPPTAARSGDPGTAVTYTLWLTNIGSLTDIFTLTKSASAWTVDMPASVGPLAAGVGVEVPVVVHIPADAAGGARDVVTVTATSQGDPTKTDTSVLTTTANNVYGVLLEPSAATRVGNPGMAVTHTLRLTNTGNTTDTFTLATSASAWTVNVPASVGPLAAGVGVEVPVVVHIPAGAPPGARDVVTVTATSQGDPTKTDASVLTTMTRAKIYLPLVMRNYFVNPYEDNDTASRAWGPLYPGVAYRAYPDDMEDWYYFNLTGQASVTVRVTDFTGGGGRLMVYREDDITNPIGYWGAGGPTMTVGPLSLSAGKYYVRVYTGGATNTTQLYTLMLSW